MFEECCRDGDDDALWAASLPVAIGGVPTRIPAPEDQLIHACVHGEKWVRVPGIRWIADAVALVRDGQVRWDRLVEQAVRRRFVLRLRVQLAYLAATFDAPDPAGGARRAGRRSGLAAGAVRAALEYARPAAPLAPRLLVQSRPVGARWVGRRHADIPAVPPGDMASAVPRRSAGGGRQAPGPSLAGLAAGVTVCVTVLPVRGRDRARSGGRGRRSGSGRAPGMACIWPVAMVRKAAVAVLLLGAAVSLTGLTRRRSATGSTPDGDGRAHLHHCFLCEGEWSHRAPCRQGRAWLCPWCLADGPAHAGARSDRVASTIREIGAARRRRHGHRCPRCLTTWVHRNARTCTAGDRVVLPECPGCRRRQDAARPLRHAT